MPRILSSLRTLYFSLNHLDSFALSPSVSPIPRLQVLCLIVTYDSRMALGMRPGKRIAHHIVPPTTTVPALKLEKLLVEAIGKM
jgi:hypothetical protein